MIILLIMFVRLIIFKTNIISIIIALEIKIEKSPKTLTDHSLKN